EHADVRFVRRQADARDHLVAYALDRHDVRGAFAHERDDVGVNAADDLRARVAFAARVTCGDLAVERGGESGCRVEQRGADGAGEEVSVRNARALDRATKQTNDAVLAVQPLPERHARQTSTRLRYTAEDGTHQPFTGTAICWVLRSVA